MYLIIFLEAKTLALIIKLKGNLLKYYHMYEKEGFTISFESGQRYNYLPKKSKETEQLFLGLCAKWTKKNKAVIMNEVNFFHKWI